MNTADKSRRYIPRRWEKLDNAAKIYPAAMSNNWTALFRVSAELSEPVDPAILARAQQTVLKRFPSFSLRLRRGLFWYYLERLDGAPDIQPDVANPCVRMDMRSNGGFMFRTRYYQCRIAVEIFHVLTDGTGGMIFLKTLVAEYLRLKYGADIPCECGVLDCREQPLADEMTDSFGEYARRATAKRHEIAAYRLRGTVVEPHFLNVITGILPADAVSAKAKSYGATVTEYIASVLVMSICTLQQRELSLRRRHQPVKVSIPVNLRRYYPTNTLRNFASYVNIGVDSKLGVYSFEEILGLIKSYMKIETNEKMLNAKIATNVASERNPLLRLTPLVIKDAVMKAVFLLTGDRYSSTTLSNLGRTQLPQAMQQYVTRLDFMLGPMSLNPVTAACVSYNNVMTLNFTRTVTETDLERIFFTNLVKMGIPVKIESNQRY